MSTYPSSFARTAVLSDLVAASRLRQIVLVLGGAALVGLTAQLSFPVPGTPVPVTGQTFAVLVVGAALGAHRAALSLVLYLLAGAAGVGWFADGESGTRAPSFGYVVGFIAAATLVGYLAGRGQDRTVLRTAGTMALGTLVIYLVGVPWLAVALDVSVGEAVRLGVRPFLVGDLLKIALAAGVLPLAWAAVKRWERPKR